MVSLIFIVLTAAMVLVWRGHRSGSMAAFALAAVLAVVWFNHHITDPLQLGFLIMARRNELVDRDADSCSTSARSARRERATAPFLSLAVIAAIVVTAANA